MVVSQGALTGLLTKLFGEVVVIRLSLVATAAGFGLMLLATSYISLLLSTGVLVLSIALLSPALNSLISARTALQQGITMGVNNSFAGLGRVLGPLWAGFIFDVHVDFPFLSSVVILILGFIISLIYLSQTPSATGPVTRLPLAKS